MSNTCEFCRNSDLWEPDYDYSQIEENLRYDDDWREDVDSDEAFENSWFLLNYRKGNTVKKRTIPTGVFSKQHYHVCHMCHILLVRYCLWDYDQNTPKKRPRKLFLSSTKRKLDALNRKMDNSDYMDVITGKKKKMGGEYVVSEVQRISEDLRLWDGEIKDASELSKIKDKYISALGEKRDETYKLLLQVKIEMEMQAWLTLSGMSTLLDFYRNTDRYIINLLDDIGKKLSAEEINKRLECGDSEYIKNTCEDLYINGEIRRDGNHRYFSLSLEITKPANKSDYIKQIKELGSLLEEGLITQAEFDDKKKELLG